MTCSTYGDNTGAYRVLVGSRVDRDPLNGIGNPKEEDHVEDLGVDRRIILKLSFNKQDAGMYWIDVVPDRDTWRAVVNMVMKLWVP